MEVARALEAAYRHRIHKMPYHAKLVEDVAVAHYVGIEWRRWRQRGFHSKGALFMTRFAPTVDPVGSAAADQSRPSRGEACCPTPSKAHLTLYDATLSSSAAPTHA